jgi:hypothetical protein
MPATSQIPVLQSKIKSKVDELRQRKQNIGFLDLIKSNLGLLIEAKDYTVGEDGELAPEVKILLQQLQELKDLQHQYANIRRTGLKKGNNVYKSDESLSSAELQQRRQQRLAEFQAWIQQASKNLPYKRTTILLLLN